MAPKGGREGGCQKWSVPSGNPGETYVSGSHRKNLPLAKYHQQHQRSVDDNEISHPPFDAHLLHDLTDFLNTSPSRCLFLTSPPISSGRSPVRVTEPVWQKEMPRQGHHSSAAPNIVS